MSRKSSSWVESILRKPHIILAFIALFVLTGVTGYNKMQRNLFPNSNYPEVALVIVQPGASAKTMASNIAVPVEEELYALDEIRRAYSNTIDEVTVIKAEFEYSKDIDTAVNDVTTALSKIRAKLPKDIKEPQIIKITEATAPILVVAMSPKGDTTLTLEDIRDIASSHIKHTLLKTQGIANVDIFGGYEKELQIIVDKDKLDSYQLSLGQVIATIQKNNNEYAVGFISNSEHRYLLKSQGKRDQVGTLKALMLTPEVKLSDVAEVYFGHYENSSAYYGNGKAAIALSIQRSISADVIQTVDKAEHVIAKFRTQYPNINFEISDTQKETIEQSTTNMFESLRDAIIMSTIVVFLFLASFRQILIVLVTIPLVYASTIALMYLFGIGFNVIGSPRKYGDAIDYDNLPEPYLKSDTIDEDKNIQTRIYQMEMLHRKFADRLNIVIIEKINLSTGKIAHVNLFSTDLTLDYEKIIDYYSLRFQIEFVFRDAKQYWGMEDFMNIKKTPIHNWANLSTFMVNFSHGLRQNSTMKEMSILDLKAHYHGIKYVKEVFKLLPHLANAYLIQTVSLKIANLGAIHSTERVG
ncbi:MAG: efflux RND transporter permease subunit [Sulfurovum sp.]|nr:efflux RND transporter permease subunit [Sulfurovum sp.]